MVHKAQVAFPAGVTLTANGTYMCRIRDGQVIPVGSLFHYGKSKLVDNSWCFMSQVCKTQKAAKTEDALLLDLQTENEHLGVMQ